jgi:Fur family transcriptional regulator, ferric uptake regulator
MASFLETHGVYRRDVKRFVLTQAYRLKDHVVDVLVDRGAPMSVAEIRGGLKGRRAKLVSIYRAVNLLCELGLLRVVDASKGTQRFELAEQFTGHHHHLICQVCGSVEDLDGCLLQSDALDAIRERVRRSRSFRLTGHDLK